MSNELQKKVQEIKQEKNFNKKVKTSESKRK